MSTTDNLALITEVHKDESGRFKGHIHQQSSVAEKDNKSSNDQSEPTNDKTRCIFVAFVIYMILKCCTFPPFLMWIAVYIWTFSG